MSLSHNANFWGLVIATGLAFSVIISALTWLYFNSKKKSGEK